MLHQLLQLLPNWLMRCAPDVLVWGAVAAFMLWVLGGRFSQSMLTLAAVTVGSWVGVRLPHLFGWGIEPMCVGVFGAIVLGTAAYLFHRTLVGLGLGALVALWAGMAAWIRFDGSGLWQPKDLHWTGSAVTWLAKLWQSFPTQLSMVLPYACGAGLAAGIITGILWPRLSRCMVYSMTGTTLLVVTCLPLTARLRPTWLEAMPPSPGAQFLILVGFLALGVAIQWWLSSEPRKTKDEDPAPEKPVPGDAPKTRLAAGPQQVRMPAPAGLASLVDPTSRGGNKLATRLQGDTPPGSALPIRQLQEVSS